MGAHATARSMTSWSIPAQHSKLWLPMADTHVPMTGSRLGTSVTSYPHSSRSSGCAPSMETFDSSPAGPGPEQKPAEVLGTRHVHRPADRDHRRDPLARVEGIDILDRRELDPDLGQARR